MIIHRPYGIDDPYKRLPIERFPRDPLPGESVRVGFEAPVNAKRAWVDVDSRAGESRHAPAASLGQGVWTADLGVLSEGRHSYVIRAEIESGHDSASELSSEEFPLEVGRWVEVNGAGEVREAGNGFVLELGTTSGQAASLALSFPTEGACRSELFIGQGAPDELEGLPCRLGRKGEVLRFTARGIDIEIDTSALTITASNPEASPPLFRGSLRSRWLVDSEDRATRTQASFSARPDEWLYGLGERFTDANRLGDEWDVRVYEYFQEQGKHTYLPVPFLVSNRNYGVWLDCDEPSRFDLRASVGESSDSSSPDGARRDCSITREHLPAKETSLPLHIFVGPGAYDVTSAFTRLTGEMRVPPKWAFGPWMSANTWNSQARTEEVLRRGIEAGVPASVLVLEAWSDESTFYIFNDAKYEPKPGGESFELSDFRFGGRWPDPKGLIDYCHEHGIRVLLWQIPVQKNLDEPHQQHERDEAHMLEQGYFVRNEDGSPYRNKGWWFADGLVVDFTNPEAREWWFSKRRYLFEELGIDGMKTDGGEHLWGRDLRAFDGRRGMELFNGYSNSYVGAYHEFIREATGGDGVTFSRAGYTGAQQFPCHWAGDEGSTWKAYQASIQAGLSAGISGVSMWAWDIAGFSGEVPSPELYLRATAMATFCPLMQYHSEPHGAAECRDRTPWNVAERHGDPQVLNVYRRYARLRMRLLDYLHSQAQELSEQGVPMMRYPALEYPQAHDFLAEDPYAYMLASDLLVAPVVERGVATRDVRLPPGDWLDLWSGAKFEGGTIATVPAPIERIPVFVRAESPRASELLEVAAPFFGDTPESGSSAAASGHAPSASAAPVPAAPVPADDATLSQVEARRPWASGAFGAPASATSSKDRSGVNSTDSVPSSKDASNIKSSESPPGGREE